LEDAAGNRVTASVFFLGGADARYSDIVRQLESWGRAGAQVRGGETAQLSRPDIAGFLRKGLRIEAPPVPASAYRELYESNFTHRSCVDAKVAYICGQGWRLRAKGRIFGSDPGIAEHDARPDLGQLETGLAFLQASEGDYGLDEMVGMVETDCQVSGNGYLELARDSSGAPSRFFYAPAEIMYIMLDYSGFVQVRGTELRFWARYGTGAKSVRLEKVRVGEEEGWQPFFVGKTVAELAREDRGIGRVWPQAVGAWIENAGVARQVATSVNDMLHFRIHSPRDSNYGMPEIHSAVDEILGGQNAAHFMLTYFSRGTVPRIMVIVRGGELAEEQAKKILEWSKAQDKLVALNSVLVLQVPGDGAEIRVERLSAEQLADGAFLKYRESCQDGIKRAHRTPSSIVETSGDTNRAESVEANTRYMLAVVGPRQRAYERPINLILRNELGVTDWVFDMEMPDLLSRLARAQIADILLRRGALSINEYRREEGLGKVAGGDQPFVIAPQQNVVPIQWMAELAEGLAKGKGAKQASREAEDKADESVAQKAAPAVMVPCPPLLELPLDCRENIAATFKPLVANPDDVEEILGLTTDGG